MAGQYSTDADVIFGNLTPPICRIGAMSDHQRARPRGQPTRFSPPKPRRPRPQRRPLGWPSPGWRQGIVPSLVRALCALTFAGYSAFEARFGDAALVVASLGLAAFVATIAYLSAKMQSEAGVGLLGPDAISIAVLPSALWVASNIQVADMHLGGSTLHFLLAAIAVLCVVAVVTMASTMLNLDRLTRAHVGVYPAGFSLIAILAAGSRFSSGEITEGLSLAWMAAAALTFAHGLVQPRSRPPLMVVGIAGFTLLIVVAGIAAGSPVSNGSNAALGYLSALAACGLLFSIPALGAKMTAWRTDEPAGRPVPTGSPTPR